MCETVLIGATAGNGPSCLRWGLFVENCNMFKLIKVEVIAQDTPEERWRFVLEFHALAAVQDAVRKEKEDHRRRVNGQHATRIFRDLC